MKINKLSKSNFIIFDSDNLNQENANYEKIQKLKTKLGESCCVIKKLRTVENIIPPRILKEYLSIREGTGEDFLFPNETNQQLTENALRLAIEKYNKSRGVSKTSIHLFRHYFAKTYIQNGGDCFRLQKILGHKKIEMTVHYANLYGTDTKRGFEDFSALAVATSNSQRIKAPSRR